MSRTLIQKTLRDYLLLWAGAVGLLLVFVILYMFAANSLSEDRHLDYLQLPWIRRLISAMIGADVVGEFTPTTLVCFAYSHPMMWTILIAFTCTVTSGVLAGETDRGTMDLLAGMPISRGRIYASLTAVILIMGLVLVIAIWLGTCLGTSLLHSKGVDLPILALVGAHLYAAFVCVACFCLSISGMCDRRGPALTIAFVVIFYAFLVNLLAAFWEPATRISWTGLLHYYRPLPIVHDRSVRWGDVAVLLGAAAGWSTVGWAVFRRRDLHGA